MNKNLMMLSHALGFLPLLTEYQRGTAGAGGVGNADR